MRNKKFILPILGITSAVTCAAPVIASCSCSINSHVWYSPRVDKRRKADDDNKALFVFVLNRQDYKESDFKFKINSRRYADVLTIDSYKVNLDTLEVYVKCIDTSMDQDIPFSLEISTENWTETIDKLVLAVESSVSSIDIDGASTIELTTPSTYTATVRDKSGKAIEDDVTWSIVSGEGVVFTPSGKTCIVTASELGDVVLRATSVKRPTVHADKPIKVDYSTASVEISGDDSIHQGEIKEYTATITPSTAQQKVTWSIDPSTPNAEIVAGSVTDTKCQIKGLNHDTTVKLIATPVKGEAANKSIDVIKPYAESIKIKGPTEIWSDTAQAYTAEVTPSEASQSATWSVTTGTDKASINAQTGLLTPVSGTYGDVTIKAVAEDPVVSCNPDTMNVTLKLPATSFVIDTIDSETSITLPASGTATKQFVFNPTTYTTTKVLPTGASYTGTAYSWTSSNTNVASIDATSGLLTAKTAGTTTITAKLQSKDVVNSQNFTFTVNPPVVTGLEIQGPNDIWEDDPASDLKFSVKQTPTASVPDVEWAVYDAETGTTAPTGVTIAKSGNYAYLSIDNTAFVANADVYVAAKDKNTSVEATRYKVSIKALLDSFTITGDNNARVGETQPTYTYNASSTQTYDATSIKWSSSNTAVATIGQTDGVLKSIKSGTTTISATIKTHNTTIAATNTINVTVNKPYATNLSLVAASDSLWFDASEADRKLTATLTSPSVTTDTPSQKVTWSIDQEAIASHVVSTTTDGVGTLVLTGNAEGNVTVTATAADGSTNPPSDTVTIAVMRPATKVEFTIAPASVDVPNTATYVAIATDDNDVTCTHGTMQYSIAEADSEYASIDANTGILTANKKKASGTVTVKATYVQDGREDISTTTTVTINSAKASSVSINGPSTIPTGNAVDYSAVVPSGQEDTYTWAISNESATDVANFTNGEKTVTGQTASVNPLLKGTFTLTVTTSTGVSSSITVTVTTSYSQIFLISDDGTTVEGFQTEAEGYTETNMKSYVGYDTTHTTGNTLVFPTDTNITTIKASAFDGLISTGSLAATAGVTKIAIPSNITIINDSALVNNAIIEEVDIAGAATIGASAFTGNSALETLNAPSVVSIGVSAFEGDSELTTINLGDSVSTQSIGNRAFADITNTNTVTLTANPATIGTEAFENSTNLIWPGINNASYITYIGEAAFEGTQLLATGSTLKVTHALSTATICRTAFYACQLEGIEMIPQVSDTMYLNWASEAFAYCPKLAKIDISSWTTGIPSNLANKTQLFYYANEELTTGIWYYPANTAGEPTSEFTTWMTAQIGEETIDNWTATGQ